MRGKPALVAIGCVLICLAAPVSFAQKVPGSTDPRSFFRDRPVELKILRTSSSVTFYSKATFHWFTGTTREIRGSARIRGAQVLPDGENRVAIQARTFDTSVRPRDAAVRNILDVECYPEISFRLKGLKVVEESPGIGDYRLKVIGDLYLHGVTREYTIPVFFKVHESKVMVTGEWDVLISDHGIEPPTFLWILKVQDKVAVKFSIQADYEQLPVEAPDENLVKIDSDAEPLSGTEAPSLP